MVEIPIAVGGDETTVRALFHPFHLKRDKIKWEAFRPPPLRQDVSVIRRDYVSAEECRGRAKAMEKDGKVFRGFASLKVQAVRDAGIDVIDSREWFLGHADIMHKYPAPPPGEPPANAESFDALRETCRHLAAAATYHADIGPTAEGNAGVPA